MRYKYETSWEYCHKIDYTYDTKKRTFIMYEKIRDFTGEDSLKDKMMQ